MPGIDNLFASVPVTARDIQTNVVKMARERTDFSIADELDAFLDLPSRVVLHAASGGFNTVVEFSAATCLRWFNKFSWPQDYVVPITGADLDALGADHDVGLKDSRLRRMIESDPTFDFYLGIRWSAESLEFSDPKIVCVHYSGVFALLRRKRIEAPRPIPRDRPTHIFDPLDRLEDAHLFSRSIHTVEGESESIGEASFAIDKSTSVESLIAPKAWGKQRDGLIPLAILGSLSAKLCCPYKIETEPARVRARVIADVTQANVELEPLEGDPKLLFDQLIVGAGATPGVSIFAFVTFDVLLSPSLCLLGYDTALNAPTFPHFEAFAFHVESGTRQALAVGFDCAPGCKGIIEDVQYFLGQADYGIITDELVVEGMFVHKWNRGGFLRSIGFRNPVTVKMSDGSEQTAQLGGNFRLNTLDAVRVDVDANSQIDHVLVSGSATATPTYLELGDGGRKGPGEVNLPAPSDSPWSVFTDVRLSPTYSTDPQMRSFQIRAHLDAYRFACKPFRGLPSEMIVQPIYTRTDGASRRIFYLANLTTVFG